MNILNRDLHLAHVDHDAAAKQLVLGAFLFRPRNGPLAFATRLAVRLEVLVPRKLLFAWSVF